MSSIENVKTRIKGTEVEASECGEKKICFFGHFGAGNLGNEITFQTILHHLRLRFPDAKLACICSEPEILRADYQIDTIPISRELVKRWELRTRLAKWLRRFFVGAPSELWRWVDGFRALKDTNMLIIPGTGLLTDAYGLLGFGPYSLFKWSLLAKLRGCKVLFVSVGAGPIYSKLGRWFIRLTLSLADFRSYRDDASITWVRRTGFGATNDRRYPDLAFSLPEVVLPRGDERQPDKPTIGIGLMEYAGKYSVENPNNSTYSEYQDNLAVFAQWLLGRDYSIRLLIGDVNDTAGIKQFKSLLKARSGERQEDRVIDEPALSVEQLLAQIASTEIVVATRFHNILLALVLNKPVIAISFHSKCTSLMAEMGLAEYCHDIDHMNAGKLIEQFLDVQKNAEKLRLLSMQRVERARKALDEQYRVLFDSI